MSPKNILLISITLFFSSCASMFEKVIGDPVIYQDSEELVEEIVKDVL